MPKTRKTQEDGSATVEFLGVSLLLLIPIIYLILTFAQVQAATYAAEASARAAGRIFAQANDESQAHRQAAATTSLAFADHGMDVSPADALQVSCESSPCLSPGSGIHIRITVPVPLPLVPDFLVARLPTSVNVSADAYTTVDRFKGS